MLLKIKIMKNIFKIVTVIIFITSFISCNKGPNFTQNSDTGVISFSSTIINNEIAQMNLTNPFNGVDLLINEYEFKNGNNINEFAEYNVENINELAGSFGTDMVFRLGEKEMKIYNPKIIFFDCPQYIDKTTGITITWDVDSQNENEILISVIPRLDANGNTYTNKESQHFSHLQDDTGTYTLTPDDLANFSSGDTVDIILMRGNVENFGKETIEVYNTNVHIAKIR
jgi:hypothetical protein